MGEFPSLEVYLQEYIRDNTGLEGKDSKVDCSLPINLKTALRNLHAARKRGTIPFSPASTSGGIKTTPGVLDGKIKTAAAKSNTVTFKMSLEVPEGDKTRTSSGSAPTAPPAIPSSPPPPGSID